MNENDDLTKPKEISDSTKDEDLLDKLLEKYEIEVWFGSLNFFMYIFTLIQDMPNLDGVRPPPKHTDGILGFIEGNMAGAMEVIAIFYLARIPVELIARAFEAFSDKKVDPRIKVGIAVLLSVITSSGLELITKSGKSLHGGVPDFGDATGNLVVGIYSSVGYLVIDYLFNKEVRKEEYTQLWQHVLDKFSSQINNEGKY